MTKNSSPKLKIFVHSVDGIGHLAACVGVCQPLAKRGHTITFLINEAFAGQYAKFGFNEILLKETPKPTENGDKTEAEAKPAEKKNPVKDMAEILKSSGFLGPKSPTEKLRDQVNSPQNFMDKFFNQMVEYNPQIAKAIKNERPDFFILDSFLIPPAIHQAGIPFAYLFSPNPIFLYRSKKLPPFGSGFPTDSDPETWKEYTELWQLQWKKHFLKYQIDINAKFNYEPEEKADPDDIFSFPMSKYLNIYGFPAELDYDDIAPRPKNLVGVDAFCRELPEPFEVPEKLARKPGEKLIYVSLGSMGSIDVELMKRITSVLAKTPHKYIVSKGQRGDEYELPENCWGENFLPQTKILPIVDLVITHGGNNTITETFSFGKLMIVLPLFGDQTDNAQRVQEKKFGIRIEPYTFQEQELIDAIEKLLNDTENQKRANAAAERIEKSQSKERLADRIEEVVAQFKAEHSA